MSITLSDPKLKYNFVSASDMEDIIFTYPGYDTVVITGSLMIVHRPDAVRIFDGSKGHMIPNSWIHMEWTVKDGGTVFKF